MPRIKVQTFTLLAIVICLLNAFYFMCSSAIPIIQADAWYFLDVDVLKWANEGFHWDDLFVKRGLIDHAQPMNKFFLYLNYRLFNLDFRFESFLGFLGLVLITLFFIIKFFQHIRNNNSYFFSSLIFLMAIFTLSSLNATGLYSWTLVTFQFLPLFIAIVTAWYAWKMVLHNQLFLALPFSLIAFIIVGDTAAIILWVSISIAILLLNFRSDGLVLRRVIFWICGSGIYVGIYFLILNFNFLSADSTSASAKSLNLLDLNFYLESIRIIFSSTLMQGLHLEVFGENAKLVSWVVAVPVFYFYVMHFLQLLFISKPKNDIDFLITFILTYATISIVAIIFGRVPEFGVDYLNQPRYVLVYQLIPFALFLKWSFATQPSEIFRRRLTTGAFVVFFAAFVMVQVIYSVKAHKSTRWISQWVSNQVVAISNYTNDPSIPSGNCTPHSKPICNLPVNKRNELLSLMINRQLNLFNPNFQWRYRVFPSIKTENLNVIAWGPQILSPSLQSKGIWIKLFQPIQNEASIKIRLGEIAIKKMYFLGNVITFDIPDSVKNTRGEYDLRLSIDDWKNEKYIGKLNITK